LKNEDDLDLDPTNAFARTEFSHFVRAEEEDDDLDRKEEMFVRRINGKALLNMMFLIY